MTGDELRDRYFSAMRGADLAGVLSLFAENASAILPDGNARVGKAALEEMFTGIFSQSSPNPAPGSITGTGKYWAVEVETTLPDGRVRNTANFFRLDDTGLIERMHSYMRA
jgi:SnoaL-like domain